MKKLTDSKITNLEQFILEMKFQEIQEPSSLSYYGEIEEKTCMEMEWDKLDIDILYNERFKEIKEDVESIKKYYREYNIYRTDKFPGRARSNNLKRVKSTSTDNMEKHIDTQDLELEYDEIDMYNDALGG